MSAAAGCSTPRARVERTDSRIQSYTYSILEETGDGWETSSLSEAGIDSGLVTALVQEVLTGGIKNIHSIVLVRHGKLVFEEYFYGFHKSKLHQLHSVSKSITAILVGIALDKGMIQSVQTRVHTYFQEYSGVE